MITQAQIQERDRNIAVFARVLETGFNRGDLDQLDPLFDEGFVEHQRDFPSPDLAGLKRGIASLRKAIPDIRLEITDTIGEGDKMCFVLTGSGTHLGQLGPLPPTGTELAINVIDICRFENGRIVEHWGIPDRMGIMEQIGLPQAPRWAMKVLTRRSRKKRARR